MLVYLIRLNIKFGQTSLLTFMLSFQRQSKKSLFSLRVEEGNGPGNITINQLEDDLSSKDKLDPVYLDTQITFCS